MMDKVLVGDVPGPEVGVWREITCPKIDMKTCRVWENHLMQKGLDDTEIKVTRDGSQLFAMRRGVHAHPYSM